MRFWIAVASRDHVAAGVAGGFVQMGHGSDRLLRTLGRDDGIAAYAPREEMGAGAPVRAFVAIGRVAEDAPAKDAGTGHWRRRVAWDGDARAAEIRPLLDRLDLTRGRGARWGMALRGSRVEIGEADFRLIAGAMGAAP